MKTLTIKRTFSAPQAQVFAAWADVETLKKWWAPEGMEVTKFNLQFAPNQTSHYAFSVDGFTVWGKLEYVEIDEPNKLVFTDHFTDENGAEVAPSFYEMAGDAPNPMRVEVVFSEQAGETTVTVQITTQDGSPVDPGIEEGWNGMLDKLAQQVA